MRARDLHDAVHVGHPRAEVHGQDDARARRDQPLDLVWIHAPGVIHIDKHGHEPLHERGEGRRIEGQRRHQHLFARLQPTRFERNFYRSRAARCADPGLRAVVRSELLREVTGHDVRRRKAAPVTAIEHA